MSRGAELWDRDSLRQPHAAQDKSARVRSMFNSIAPTYERINTLFSGGRDAHWRRETVRISEAGAGDRLLDVACGTGDLLRAFQRAPVAEAVGCDFARAMLLLAREHEPRPTSWCEADALRLPFAEGSFSIVSCAFGIRNFTSVATALSEFHRVLRPGGRAVVLEFAQPANRLIRLANKWYSGRFMPWAASWLARDRTGAYHYLPSSVQTFMSPAEMCGAFEEAGFADVRSRPLTFGVVRVYLGRRNA